MDIEKKFNQMIVDYGDVLVFFLQEKLKTKETLFFRGDFSPEVLFKNKTHITFVENKLFNEINFLKTLIAEIQNKIDSFEENKKEESEK